MFEDNETRFTNDDFPTPVENDEYNVSVDVNNQGIYNNSMICV